MEIIENYCNLSNGLSEVGFFERLNDLNKEDLLLFIPTNARNETMDEGICMNKQELMDYWFEHEGFIWGNCHDEEGRPVTDTEVNLASQPDRYCNRYYKIPKTGQYVSDAFANMVRQSPVQVYVIRDNDVTRNVGRNLHTIGEHNNPNEKIYSLCPSDDEYCEYREEYVNIDMESPESLSASPTGWNPPVAISRSSPIIARRSNVVDNIVAAISNTYHNADQNEPSEPIPGERFRHFLNELIRALPTDISTENVANDIIDAIEEEYDMEDEVSSLLYRSIITALS